MKLELTEEERQWLLEHLRGEYRLADYQSKNPDTIGHIASEFIPAKKNCRSIIRKLEQGEREN